MKKGEIKVQITWRHWRIILFVIVFIFFFYLTPQLFTLSTPVVFVGTNVTDKISMITSTKGSTVIFYNGFKYLKSGESKSNCQYRCANYMKKCRSRIIFRRENQTALANEISHNHLHDSTLYSQFEVNAAVTRRFGANRSLVRYKGARDEVDVEKWW